MCRWSTPTAASSPRRTQPTGSPTPSPRSPTCRSWSRRSTRCCAGTSPPSCTRCAPRGRISSSRRRCRPPAAPSVTAGCGWATGCCTRPTSGVPREASNRSVSAHVLSPLPVVTVPLGTVRSPGLAAQLREILAAGQVPVCDGETDDDLDRIVAAIAGLDRPVLVGSAGIAAAVARALTGTSPARAATVDRTAPGRCSPWSAAPPPASAPSWTHCPPPASEIVALRPRRAACRRRSDCRHGCSCRPVRPRSRRRSWWSPWTPPAVSIRSSPG